jgi:hypothetical protein
MQSTLTQTDLFRELDYRENDGIEVSLLWNRQDDSLAVVVNDTRTDTFFEVAVSREDAREAFAHPFAYASRVHLSTRTIGGGLPS